MSGYKSLGSGGINQTQYTEDYSSGNNDLLYMINRGQGNPATTDFLKQVINSGSLRTEYSRQGGTGNAVSFLHVIPKPLLNPSVNGQNQFAQAKLGPTARAAAYDDGPAVMLQGDNIFDQGVQNGGNGYVFAPTPGALPQQAIVRRASISESVPLSTGVNVTNGDVMRIEVRLINSGTQWEVKAFVNGVQAGATLVEAVGGVAPVVSYGGYPGHHVGNIPIPTANLTTWQQESWGIL